MKLGLRVITVGCALAAVVAMLPSDAAAQGRRPAVVRARPAVVRARPAVVVRPRTAVVVRGYYRPFFYDPWYNPYYGYGWYGSGAFGYQAYPPYYGRGYYDVSASVRLQVEPREAEVFVDGYFAGVVDNFDGVLQRLRAEPGEHDLELFLPGYRSVRQRLYLQPGVTSHVRLVMEPLAPGDPQPIRPEGAPRPRATGSAPIENVDPRSGPAVRQRPTAPTGPEPREGPPQESARLENGFGELALRVQPADAEVLIDGERWEGPAENERLMLQLGGGVHHVEVRKDGYRSYLSDITVRDGRTTTLNIALTRQ